MLKKEELTRDFIVFVLCQLPEYVELITIELANFFETYHKSEDVFNPNYSLFHFGVNNFKNILNSQIDTSKILNDNKLNNSSELPFSKKEIDDLILYFKKNHYTGYPDGSDGGDLLGSSEPLELTELDIFNYWYSYNEFRIVNDDVYISYDYQKINYLNLKCKKLLDEYIRNIDTFKKSIEDFDKETRDELIASHIQEHKKVFLKDISSSDFQLMGFVDRNGYFIDIKQSTQHLLKNQPNSSELGYNFSLPSYEKSIAYLKLQLLKNKLIGENYDDSKNNLLQPDFLDFKKKHKDFVSYLMRKSLDNVEINTILNLVSGNKFNSSEIRNIENISQIDYFRYSYLFYLFDYQFTVQENPLKSIKNFESMASIPEGQIKIDPEQIRKYYQNIQTGDFDKNNPFPSKKSIDYLDGNLKKLGIDRGKLNSIPEKYLN